MVEGEASLLGAVQLEAALTAQVTLGREFRCEHVLLAERLE